MIRISKQTDYGIVLLTLMSSAPSGQSFTARALSVKSQIPLPMVQKVLKLLSRQDFLRSLRGAQGGYVLNHDPVDISMAQLIEAFEGPIAVTECSSTEDQSCGYGGACPVSAHWRLINEAIRSALDKVKLTDMNQKPGCIPDFTISSKEPVARP